MSYSFTEKKRIRKSFASRPSVLEVPSLLDIQLRSYEDFLQVNVKPAARSNNLGLQAAFTSIFPITSHNGFARLRMSLLSRNSTLPNASSVVLPIRAVCARRFVWKSTIARLLSLRPLRKFVRTTSIWAKCL